MPYQAFMEALISSPDAILDPRPRLFVLKDKKGGPQQLAFARPIIIANNSLVQPFKVNGLLVVTLSPEKLINKVLATGSFKYDFFRLLDKDGIIFEDRPRQTLNFYERSSPISLGRADQILSISIGRSSKDILSQVILAYRAQAFVALLFIALMLFVVKHLANKLAQPLRVLSELTTGMSASNFKQAVLTDIDTASIEYQEFSEVFRLLRAMESTIREQFMQLHEANANLEGKVVERTLELEKNMSLLNKQRASLNSLVQYSIDIQQTTTMDEAGRMTLALAERICHQKVGIGVSRSECFPGYRNCDGIDEEGGQFIRDNSSGLYEYSSLMKLVNKTSKLQFFAIGSSTLSYQGFLVTEKSERSDQANESLMVLCTMFNSAVKQLNLNGKLHRLAHVDSVTNLPNRHYFTSTFKEKYCDYINESVHFSVFVIDINGLKTINDQYGHEQGDEMLKIVASAIKSVARTNDTVARVGGDEFYVLLEKANSEGCAIFEARLIKIITNLSMTIDGQTIPVSFSFGFASTDLDSVDKLISLADERMYAAKKKHYETVFNTPQISS